MEQRTSVPGRDVLMAAGGEARAARGGEGAAGVVPAARLTSDEAVVASPFRD